MTVLWFIGGFFLGFICYYHLANWIYPDFEKQLKPRWETTP